MIDCTSCKPQCAAGKQHLGCGLSQPGACYACVAGQHKSAAGTHACSACAAGKVTAAVGTIDCTPCRSADKKFQDRPGQTTCETCDFHCEIGHEKTLCGEGDAGTCEKCSAGQAKSHMRSELCRLAQLLLLDP